MATKPSKTATSVAHHTTPAKKVTSASKAATSKNVVSAKPAKQPSKVHEKLNSKTSHPEKKEQPKSLMKKSAVTKTKEKTKELNSIKPVLKMSENPKKETSKTPASAKKDASSSKAVIVPSKPAINPKPALQAKSSDSTKAGKTVVVPKTSTDKIVDYEPEFTKSVLDSPIQQPTNPTMRYSDAELQEFRDLINKKLDAAKKELAYLQGLITRKDEMGGDEAENRYMTMEDGSMSMEREQLSQMASRQITFIDHLEKALMRIENKTYGICRITGKLIDKARLRAVPHATLSMEAKLGIAK